MEIVTKWLQKRFCFRLSLKEGRTLGGLTIRQTYGIKRSPSSVQLFEAVHLTDCESAKPKPISILHLVLAKLSSLAWRIQRWRKQLGSCLFCLACTRSSNLMKTFAFCARKNINTMMYIMHECKEIPKIPKRQEGQN